MREKEGGGGWEAGGEGNKLGSEGRGWRGRRGLWGEEREGREGGKERDKCRL